MREEVKKEWNDISKQPDYGEEAGKEEEGEGEGEALSGILSEIADLIPEWKNEYCKDEPEEPVLSEHDLEALMSQVVEANRNLDLPFAFGDVEEMLAGGDPEYQGPENE